MAFEFLQCIDTGGPENSLDESEPSECFPESPFFTKGFHSIQHIIAVCELVDHLWCTFRMTAGNFRDPSLFKELLIQGKDFKNLFIRHEGTPDMGSKEHCGAGGGS